MQNVLIILRCSMNSRCGETKYQVPFQWVPDHVSTKGVYIVVSKEDWRRCPTLNMLGSIIGGAGFRTQLKPSCCNHCSSFIFAASVPMQCDSTRPVSEASALLVACPVQVCLRVRTSAATEQTSVPQTLYRGGR